MSTCCYKRGMMAFHSSYNHWHNVWKEGVDLVGCSLAYARFSDSKRHGENNFKGKEDVHDLGKGRLLSLQPLFIFCISFHYLRPLLFWSLEQARFTPI